MPRKKFAWAAGEERLLSVEWSGKPAHYIFRWDDEVILELAEGALRVGATLHIPGRGPVEAKVSRFLQGAPELELSTEAGPLPGAANDPLERVRVAAKAILVIGAILGILGVSRLRDQPDILSVVVAFGNAAAIVFLALAFWATRSVIALGLASTLLAARLGHMLVLGISRGQLISLAVVPFIIVVGRQVWRAFQAAQELRRIPEQTGVGAGVASDSEGQPWEPPK